MPEGMTQAEMTGLGWPFSAVRFRVFGVPAPKGSMKIMRRGAKAWLIPDNPPALERWTRAVAGSAMAAVHRAHARPVFALRPLAVEITFVLERVTATAKKAQWAHYSHGDLDKLVRATLDPMEGLVFDNDRRIVELTARKRYEDPGSGLPLGAQIDVWPLDAA